MTGEYIDKWFVVHKLIQLENTYQFYKEQWDADVLYRRICELEIGIGKIKPAEVEPVVHAHWVDRPDGAYRICSNCRSGVPTIQRPLAWFRCPICGAHMDEEVEPHGDTN